MNNITLWKGPQILKDSKCLHISILQKKCPRQKKCDVLHILENAENNFAAACKVNAVVCKENFSQTTK